MMLQYVVAAAAAMGVFYVLLRPQWAILLIVLMFPLEQILQAYVPALRDNQTLVNYAIGFVSLFALLSKVFKGEPVLGGYNNGGTYALVLLYILCWVGLFWSPSRESALGMLRFALPYYALMTVLAPLLMSTTQQWKSVLTGTMALGGIIAVLILMSPASSFYAGRLYVDVSQFAGQRGGRGNPLALAELGSTMALIAVLIKFEAGKVWMTVLRGGAFVAGMALAISSGSRGQVLAAVLVAVLFYPLARRIANPKQFLVSTLGLGVIGAGFFLMFQFFIGDENRARWDPVNMIESVAGRFQNVTDLLGTWLASPVHWLFGLGTNAYSSIRPENYVHNVVAEALGEFGIVGLGILGGFMWMTWRACRNLWLLHRDDEELRSAAALLGAMCAFSFLMSLKQGSFVSSPLGFLYWILACCIWRWSEIAIARGEYEFTGDSEFDSQHAGDDWEQDDYALAKA